MKRVEALGIIHRAKSAYHFIQDKKGEAEVVKLLRYVSDIEDENARLKMQISKLKEK